jgi:hypothetical protein
MAPGWVNLFPARCAERIHADDTTAPVLAKGKCRTGRLWTYVRDDRPFAGMAAPAAVFFYSADRGAVHADAHLATYRGLMQADAYAGFNRLNEGLARCEPVEVQSTTWAVPPPPQKRHKKLLISAVQSLFQELTVDTTVDTNDQTLLQQLEQLDVIESSELAVGNAFHAFRFSTTHLGEKSVQDQPVKKSVQDQRAEE